MLLLIVMIIKMQAYSGKRTWNTNVFSVRDVHHFSLAMPTLTRAIHYLCQGPRPPVKPVDFRYESPFPPLPLYIFIRNVLYKPLITTGVGNIDLFSKSDLKYVYTHRVLRYV
jgi:hypothetical protein